MSMNVPEVLFASVTNMDPPINAHEAIRMWQSDCEFIMANSRTGFFAHDARALKELGYTHVCIALEPQDGQEVGATLKL